MVKSSLSTSLHIMALLALYTEGWRTSTKIAASININPVLVRQELRKLKSAGLIESKEGKHGGVRLAKSAQNILLSDIFKVVKEEKHVLDFRSDSPSKSCRVGTKINTVLDNLYNDIDVAVIEKLQDITLESFKNNF